MGVTARLPPCATRLLDAGADPTTPVAIVENGTRPTNGSRPAVSPTWRGSPPAAFGRGDAGPGLDHRRRGGLPGRSRVELDFGKGVLMSKIRAATSRSLTANRLVDGIVVFLDDGGRGSRPRSSAPSWRATARRRGPCAGRGARRRAPSSWSSPTSSRCARPTAPDAVRYRERDAPAAPASSTTSRVRSGAQPSTPRRRGGASMPEVDPFRLVGRVHVPLRRVRRGVRAPARRAVPRPGGAAASPASSPRTQFKPLRLMNGLYLQLHAYMLRIAIPYGTLTSRSCASWPRSRARYDKGYGHFTTRQNLQFNWIKLEDSARHPGRAGRGRDARHPDPRQLHPQRHRRPLRRRDGRRDRRPALWAEIIRQWSTLHPEFSFLPRKFKIAVTGSPQRPRRRPRARHRPAL